MSRRRLRAGVTALVLTAALGACSSGGADVAAPESTAELPEGDPGTGAPEVPEPSGAAEAHDDEPAKTEVPPEAVLDAPTLSGVAGGTWQVQPSGPQQAGPCGPLPETGAAASRTVRLSDERGRVLVETVRAFRHGQDGPAVDALAASFADCGWRSTEAPPLGERSAQATSAAGTALVFSAEGAVVVLTGTGGLAEDAGVWEAVADVALGSSCPAAPEGCH